MREDEWPDSRVQKLRELWPDFSIPTKRIAEMLGVSKNSAIGKAHRLDLVARPSPIKRDAAPRATPLPRAPKQTLPPVEALPPPPVVVALPPLPVALPLPVIAARPPAQPFRAPAPPAVRAEPKPPREVHCGCQWIAASQRPWLICDQPAVKGPEGRSWCAEHRPLVYVRVPDREPETAPFVGVNDRAMGRVFSAAR